MKRFALVSLFVFTVLFAVWAVPAFPATLQLRDGTLIQGKYLGGTGDNVNLLVNGKVKTYPVSQVLLLEFGSNSPVSASPAPKPAASATQAKAPSTQAAKPAAPAGTKKVTVPSGTEIEVRMIDTISSSINNVGDKFQASLEQPLEVDGTPVAPKGTTVYGRLVQAKQAGRLEGQSELRLELTGIEINGVVASISTSDYQAAGSSRGKQTATRAGIGAGLGAIIGAIAGGGKGAAIGAGVGGGAGAATQIVTHGQQVNIPSETVLDFSLAQPLTVTAPASTAR